MANLLNVFVDSFLLLKKEPKLFLPKIIVAFLFGALMVFSAATMAVALRAVYSSDALAAARLLPQLVFLLVLSFGAVIVDLLVSAMYSFIARDYLAGRKPSVMASFRASLGKSFVVVPAALSAEIIMLAASLPFAIAVSFALSQRDFLLAGLIALAMAVVFVALNALFYLVYPVSALHSGRFFSALFESLALSRRHFKRLSLMSVASLAISIISLALAFFASNPAALLAFVVLRFAIALLATYSILLNPVFYLEFERKCLNVLPALRKRKRHFH